MMAPFKADTGALVTKWPRFAPAHVQTTRVLYWQHSSAVQEL